MTTATATSMATTALGRSGVRQRLAALKMDQSTKALQLLLWLPALPLPAAAVAAVAAADLAAVAADVAAPLEHTGCINSIT